MRLVDRLLLGLGTPLLLGCVVWAAMRSAQADRSGAGFAAAARAVADAEGTGPLLPAAVPTSQLPEGVRIDPQTLELVGLKLDSQDGSEVVEWSTLKAYEYQEGLAGIPASLSDLDGRQVTMAGFLLPLYEFDDIREFNLVASHWSCCFGVPPGLSGWVHVKLARGHKGLRNSTEPLLVTGTLSVKEHLEAGYVVSIYSLLDAKASVIGW
jgi:hypothetical protein